MLSVSFSLSANIHGYEFQHYTSSSLKGHMESHWSMCGLPWLHIEVDKERLSRVAVLQSSVLR